jgi:hypothetical protein
VVGQFTQAATAKIPDMACGENWGLNCYACNMLDRFTKDMQSIAQPGGLTMANEDLTNC